MELGTSVQRLRVWGPLCTHAFHWSAGERLYRNGALGDLEVEHRRENGHDFEEGETMMLLTGETDLEQITSSTEVSAPTVTETAIAALLTDR